MDRNPSFLKKGNSPQIIELKNNSKIYKECQVFLKIYEKWSDWRVDNPKDIEFVQRKISLKHKFRPNGVTVRYQYYKQKNRKPKGLIFNHHGFTGSQNGCCYHSHLLSNLGYDVIGFDQEGHGKTGGNPKFKNQTGHILNACEFFKEILMKEKREEYKNLPVFLWGISLGGQTVLGMLLQEEFMKVVGNDRVCGVVMLCPAVDPIKTVPMPNFFNLKNQIDGYSDVLRENLNKIRVPFLLFHGDADNLIRYNGAELLYKDAESKDKTLVKLVGASHMVTMDWCGELIAHYCTLWIENRL